MIPVIKVKDIKDAKIEKIEIKEHKNEKVEIKEIKIEKNEKIEHKEVKEHKIEKVEKNEKLETKEFDKHQKEKPEKELFEKLQDKGFDKNQEKGFEVPTPGADGSGVAERLAQLEQSVAALSHFIPADLRPDMGASALSREQDLQALSEGMAAQSEAAKASKDVRDVS